MAQRSRLIRALPLVTSCLAAAGCRGDEPERITWEPERRVTGTMIPGARLVLTDAGIPAMQQAWQPVRWPDDSAACTKTMVAVPARGDTAYAAWWTPAAGTGVAIVVARSDNGVAWRAPVPVAVFDAGAAPCDRAVPSVAADPGSSRLHLAFAAGAPGAVHLYLARSDDGGATFSAPATLATSAQPPAVALAAMGDTVAAAYIAGVRADGVVRLAISLRKGQIPELIGAVSTEDARAFTPAVALRDGKIAVGWNEAHNGDRPAAAVARVGRINR